MKGVGIASRCPQLAHGGADDGVEFDRALGFLQHRGLEGAEPGGDIATSFALCSMGQPKRAPMAAASRIAAEQNSRTSGSARMRSPVAPVSALTGFIVMLPHSLYQIS